MKARILISLLVIFLLSASIGLGSHVAYAAGEPIRVGELTLKVVAASNATAGEKAQADYVCTGTGDQTVINAAISAGYSVVLSNGTFTINGPITKAVDNVTLEGQGKGTQIYLANASSCNMVAVGGDGWTISNIYFNFNALNQDVAVEDVACVYVAGKENTRIENNFFYDCWNAVFLQSATGVSKCSSVDIVNNDIDTFRRSGIRVGNGTEYVRIDGNHIHDGVFNTHFGYLYGILTDRIAMTDTTYARPEWLEITNNQVHDSFYEGIDVHGASHVLISGNHVYNIATAPGGEGEGIYLATQFQTGYGGDRTCSDWTVENNQIENVGGIAIFVSVPTAAASNSILSDVNISGNIITTCWYGIKVYNIEATAEVNTVTISENTVNSFSAHGIMLDARNGSKIHSVAVSGNSVSTYIGSESWCNGIYLYAANDSTVLTQVSITGNDVYGYGATADLTNDILVYGNGVNITYVDISDNVLDGGTYGIYLSGSSAGADNCTADGNLITGVAYGIQCTDGDDFITTNNRITATSYPIYVSDANVVRPVITGNNWQGSTNDPSYESATDPVFANNIDKDGVQWIVSTVAVNQAPVLVSVGDRSVNAGELLTFTISATDPDGDALTYSASNLPEGATFDPDTQTFSWTPASAGTFTNIQFMVSDGELTDSEGTTFMVSAVAVNQAPVLVSVGDRTVNEGELLTFTISATDPDGDALTYSASNLPEGATFDPDTQTFSWTPDEAGTHLAVHFEVSDGSLTDSEGATFIVSTIPAIRTPVGGGGGGGGGGGSFREATLTVDLGGTSGKAEVRAPQWLVTTPVAVTSADAKTKFEIGSHTKALTADGNIPERIQMRRLTQAPSVPATQGIVSAAYEFSPDGTTFSPPATLTLTYDPAEIPEGVPQDNLGIAYWDTTTNEWVMISSAIDPVNHTITAEVSHFTIFAIIGSRPPVPNFKISSLSVSPDEVDAGESVNISMSVSNIGGAAGTYELTLGVDDMVEATKEITLEPGAEEAVCFGIAKETAGTYTVDINNITGSFVVKETPQEELLLVTPLPAAPVFSWATLGAIIGATLVSIIALVSIILLRQRRMLRRFGPPPLREG
jgi:hypothetical protein